MVADVLDRWASPGWRQPGQRRGAIATIAA
jgi:hypothetical protein